MYAHKRTNKKSDWKEDNHGKYNVDASADTAADGGGGEGKVYSQDERS